MGDPPHGQPRFVGRPKSDDTKKLMTIRLDQDIIDKYKADGPGWQTRINADLRKRQGL